MDITSIAWYFILLYIGYYIVTTVVGSLRHYSAENRTLTQELKKVRAAANDAAQTLRIRNDEVQALKLQVATLSARTTQSSGAVLQLELQARAARAEVDTLRSRLAASEARCAELQDAADKASVVRWELASKFGTNEEARVAALSSLRRPPERFNVLTSRPVTRTQSEALLLAAVPDVAVSDSSDDGEEKVESKRAGDDSKSGVGCNSDNTVAVGAGQPRSMPDGAAYIGSGAGESQVVCHARETVLPSAPPLPILPPLPPPPSPPALPQPPQARGTVPRVPRASTQPHVRRRARPARAGVDGRLVFGDRRVDAVEGEGYRTGMAGEKSIGTWEEDADSKDEDDAVEGWIGNACEELDEEDLVRSAGLEMAPRPKSVDCSPQAVSLQRAPWTSAAEASKALLGLAMDDLVTDADVDFVS